MYRILDLISETGSGGLGTAKISVLVYYPLITCDSGKGHHRPGIVEAFYQQYLPWGLCFPNEDRLSGTR